LHTQTGQKQNVFGGHNWWGVYRYNISLHHYWYYCEQTAGWTEVPQYMVGSMAESHGLRWGRIPKFLRIN